VGQVLCDQQIYKSQVRSMPMYPHVFRRCAAADRSLHFLFLVLFLYKTWRHIAKCGTRWVTNSMSHELDESRICTAMVIESAESVANSMSHRLDVGNGWWISWMSPRLSKSRTQLVTNSASPRLDESWPQGDTHSIDKWDTNSVSHKLDKSRTQGYISSMTTINNDSADETRTQCVTNSISHELKETLT